MPTFPLLLQAQGAPLPPGLPGPVFCQNKGRRTANTQHCQCNLAPRQGSTRTSPQGQRRDRNISVSRAEPEPPAGHQPPSQPSLLSKQAEPGGHLRSEKHDIQHSEIGTHKDVTAPAQATNPVGLVPCFLGRSPSLVCLLLQLRDPAGKVCLTRCRREAWGSPRWDRQRWPGNKGTAHTWTWPVSRSCPLPPHQAGNTDPRHQQESQALPSPCARAPVTHPACENTCW